MTPQEARDMAFDEITKILLEQRDQNTKLMNVIMSLRRFIDNEERK